MEVKRETLLDLLHKMRVLDFCAAAGLNRRAQNAREILIGEPEHPGGPPQVFERAAPALAVFPEVMSLRRHGVAPLLITPLVSNAGNAC